MSSNSVVINALVDGGHASGGPPLGPALGPTGVNIQQVVKAINDATAEFEGLKVPVRLEVNPVTKTFEIHVETPMTSALLLKEAGITKGSGTPTTKMVGNVTMEQVIKIARLKAPSLLSHTLKNQVREVVGTAYSCGITIDGHSAREINQMIEAGEYDNVLEGQ